MDLEPNDLLLYARVVDEGSFSRAAERLGLPKSTVQRIVKSLCDERLLVSDPPGSGIRLGPGLLRLATAALRAVEIRNGTATSRPPECCN